MALRLCAVVLAPTAKSVASNPRSWISGALSRMPHSTTCRTHPQQRRSLFPRVCDGARVRDQLLRTFPRTPVSNSLMIRSCSDGSPQQQLNERLAPEIGIEMDEDVSAAAEALREFELVSEDLEAENERNVDEDARSGRRRRPMCYYFTQGLCTLMEEKEHADKFNHVYPNLKVRPVDLKRVKEQPFEFYLVLDLEGMVEILEFPVLLIDAKTLEVVDRFHRFVRPVVMTAERQAEYIKGKYGKWRLDRVWHDTAIPFTEVLNSFESWMENHSLYDPINPSKLTRAAFVTCGNWDVKTKIPEQCRDSGIELKPYFNEWINLKDIYYNFYKKRAGGMLAMLNGLNIPLSGTHHVGLDDAHNIARVLQRMLAHGAVIKISAKRKASDPKAVRWTFASRVK